MIEKISNYFSTLTAKEKNIIIAALFLGYFLITALMAFAMSSVVESKKADLIEKEEMLQKIETMKSEYRKELAKQEAAAKKIKGNRTNLQSYISSVKETAPVDIKSIKELKPEKKGEFSIERVEISIDKIELKFLYNFLYSIENESQYIFIDSISLKKRFDKMNYQATAVVATLKEAKEE